MARGAIGQNLSYCPEYERISHGVINAAKVSRAPEVSATGVILRVYIGCSAEDYGVYTLDAPRPLPRPKLLNAKGAVSDTSGPGWAKPDGGYWIRLDEGNQLTLQFPAGTDLTGIQLLRPGYGTPTTPETGRWTREFIAYMKALNPGVIRSMDWLRTNGSKVTTWDSRCKLEDERWNVEGKGGPLEPLIELCNLLDADLWFNVPAMATDSYVTGAASLIKAMLWAKLAALIEYSNEVWNTYASIAQNTAYCKAQGVADPQCDGPNDTVKCRQWYAKRAAQIAAIFRDEFGADAYRVRPVLAGQAAYPEQLDWSIDWIEKHVGPLASVFYGIAVSPYFGATDYVAQQPDGPLSPEYFYAQGYRFADPIKDAKGNVTGWQNQRTEPGVYLIDRATAYLRSEKGQRFFKQAKGKGVKALAYEGGLGIKTKKGANVLPAVCADPRIGEVMRTHFDEWYAQGGDVYCHFVAVAAWDDDSSYGASDRITATPGPKAAAIALASASRPLPYAEPPPDPRDVRIKELETTVSNQEAAMVSQAEMLLDLKAKLAAEESDRDRLASKLSAIQQIANAQ